MLSSLISETLLLIGKQTESCGTLKSLIRAAARRPIGVKIIKFVPNITLHCFFKGGGWVKGGEEGKEGRWAKSTKICICPKSKLINNKPILGRTLYTSKGVLRISDEDLREALSFYVGTNIK